jgi:hypothetical protein
MGFRSYEAKSAITKPFCNLAYGHDSCSFVFLNLGGDKSGHSRSSGRCWTASAMVKMTTIVMLSLSFR